MSHTYQSRGVKEAECSEKGQKRPTLHLCEAKHHRNSARDDALLTTHHHHHRHRQHLLTDTEIQPEQQTNGLSYHS